MRAEMVRPVADGPTLFPHQRQRYGVFLMEWPDRKDPTQWDLGDKFHDSLEAAGIRWQ